MRNKVKDEEMLTNVTTLEVQQTFTIGYEVLTEVENAITLGTKSCQIEAIIENPEKNYYWRGSSWEAISNNEEPHTPVLKTIFNECILSVLTYGAETWSITKHLEGKILSV